MIVCCNLFHLINGKELQIKINDVKGRNSNKVHHLEMYVK